MTASNTPDPGPALEPPRFAKRFSETSQAAGHGFTVGAIKWGLLRHLNHEGVLVYSLKEREHVRLLAEIRNASFGGGRGVGPGVPGPTGPRLSGLRRGQSARRAAWWQFDTEARGRRVWNSFLAILSLYSVIMVPYRLGFRAEAQGAWFLLVS